MTRKLLSAVLVAMMLAMFIPSGYAVTTMYVYTENGGHLNVRSGPFVGDNAIGKLEYGNQVGVEGYVNGWAVIVWGGYGSAYVQARYLVNYYPGPKPTKKPGPAPVITPAPKSGGTLGDINEEFRSARKVDMPYTVVSRPARASGWVNLRWAPSTDAHCITTCPQGYELRVLAELKNWYQVQDATTGMIGFIMKSYVTRK